MTARTPAGLPAQAAGAHQRHRHDRGARLGQLRWWVGDSLGQGWPGSTHLCFHGVGWARVLQAKADAGQRTCHHDYAHAAGCSIALRQLRQRGRQAGAGSECAMAGLLLPLLSAAQHSAAQAGRRKEAGDRAACALADCAPLARQGTCVAPTPTTPQPPTHPHHPNPLKPPPPSPSPPGTGYDVRAPDAGGDPFPWISLQMEPGLYNETTFRVGGVVSCISLQISLGCSNETTFRVRPPAAVPLRLCP